MSARLPPCSGRQVMRALERLGFSLHRVRGSHHTMRHSGPPMRNVTVPIHGAHALKRATLLAIIKQAGISTEEFIKLL